jgi:DNA-binding transcriptional regulator YiaG
MTMKNADDSPGELRSLMGALSLNNADLGRMVGMDRGTVGLWIADPPAWLLLHLRLVVDLRRACGSVFGATLADLPSVLKDRLSFSSNESGKTPPILTQGAITLPAMATENRKPAMTPAEFDAALGRIGWRRADFARRAGVTDNTVWNWMRENTRIPGWVPSHLALLELVHALQAYVQPERPRKARSSP